MAIAKFSSGNSAAFKIKQEVFFTKDEYDLYQYFEKNMNGQIKKFKECGVNQLCPCGSNKKYKKVL